jgi:hypothetical protein
MTITPTVLTRAAAVCAIAGGAIFAGVQVGHPDLDATSIQTTDVFVRDQLKVLMCALTLAGITGMYLSQIKRNGLLGLIGYVILAAGYLGIMCVAFLAAFVLPEVAPDQTQYVDDVIAANTGREDMVGEIGALNTVMQVQGFAYVVGCLLFGIALYRANVLARWACALLAVGGVASVILGLMPDAFYRMLAYPTAIALIGLGFSLWASTRSTTAGTAAGTPPADVTIPAPRTSPERGHTPPATTTPPIGTTHG